MSAETYIAEPVTPPGSRLDTLPEIVQRADEWYDQRRGMITASAIGRLITARSMTAIEYPCPACGADAAQPCRSKVNGTPIKQAHPERTKMAASNCDQASRIIEAATGDEAHGLTALLAAERITGYSDPTYISDDMLRGIDDEPRAIDAYSAHFAPVTTCGFMIRTWGQSRLGFSPDGLVGNDGLIEIKSRRQKKQLLTVLSDEVPAENMAQLQAGLFVSGRDWIDYVSFSGGMALWVKRVYPDLRWFDAITTAVEAFEGAVGRMVTQYHGAVEGMPMTERVEQEIIL